VVPAASAKAIVKAMTTAYFAPVVTDEGFRSAQRDVAQEALLESFNPETLVRNDVFAALFSDGPQHYPTLAGAKDLSVIAIGDVRSFAARAFRSQNATLVVTGAIDPAVGGAAVSGRPPSGDESAPEAPVAPQLATSLEPVVKPFDEPSGGYGWLGPAIQNEREATAMDFIADYLFRPSTGTVARKLADSSPDALLLGQFITLHDPGVMLVVYSGKNVDALKAAVDAGLQSIQKPLDPAAFSAAVGAFKYHLLSDLQTPTQMADNFGWYCVEGNPEYAPGANGENGAYFKAAGALTPDFVASVAVKYLAKAPATVSLKPEKKGAVQ